MYPYSKKQFRAAVLKLDSTLDEKLTEAKTAFKSIVDIKDQSTFKDIVSYMRQGEIITLEFFKKELKQEFGLD